MNRLVTRLAGATAASLLVFGGILAVAIPAQAGSPPFEPDANSYGALTLYNASGDVVTSGSLADDPTVAYVAGSAAAPPADDGGLSASSYTKANLEIAAPQPGENSQEWPIFQLAGSTRYPITSGPSNLNDLENGSGDYLPVETGNSGNETLAYALTTFEPVTTTGYDNVYQLRMYQTGPGVAPASVFESTDILVDPTSQTWEVWYASTSSAASTSTTLTAPTSSGAPGTAVDLTSTVSPTAAGSVTFYDGSTVLATEAVSSGTAHFDYSPTTVGLHHLTAIFNPTSPTAFYPSTSTAYSYTVSGSKPTVTNVKITGTVKVGSAVTCSAAITGATSTVYSWLVNGASVATGDKFTIPGKDVGKSLACKVAATDSAGTTTVTSASTKIGTGPALKDTAKPKLSGAHAPGKVEKVSEGRWSPSATKYTYQWYANGKKIGGATKSSFKIANSDKGKKLTCKVTASATGYASGSATTAAVKVT
jgi:hypothetical protein